MRVGEGLILSATGAGMVAGVSFFLLFLLNRKSLIRSVIAGVAVFFLVSFLYPLIKGQVAVRGYDVPYVTSPASSAVSKGEVAQILGKAEFRETGCEEITRQRLVGWDDRTAFQTEDLTCYYSPCSPSGSRQEVTLCIYCRKRYLFTQKEAGSAEGGLHGSAVADLLVHNLQRENIQPTVVLEKGDFFVADGGLYGVPSEEDSITFGFNSSGELTSFKATVCRARTNLTDLELWKLYQAKTRVKYHDSTALIR